jgi:hypothetical protein
MKRILTEKFFNLPPVDQAAVVDASLRELDQPWLSQEDEDRAKRRRQRIESKAIRYGVWEEVK